MSTEVDFTEPKLRILIVEDDMPTISLYKLILERASYEVDGTFDGYTALKKLKESHYDLIITDYEMLGMRGDEFIRKVREVGIKTPLLLRTIKKRPDAETAQSLGIDPHYGYQSKLCGPEELLSIIRQLIISGSQLNPDG
jgi:CheY-like chemotaxis protein